MKREELEYHIISDEDLYEEKVYLKNQADKVMDVMEARIKELENLLKAKQADYDVRKGISESQEKRIAELEAKIKELEEENKHLEDYIDAYQKSEALNIEKLDKKDDRIKELEQALSMASDPALHPTCNDCDKCQPKWVSVKDRLPEEGVFVYAVGQHLEGLFCFKENEWYTKEEVEDEPNSYWEVQGYDKDAIDYWMEKPLPPTTEDSSATEKEK